MARKDRRDVRIRRDHRGRDRVGIVEDDRQRITRAVREAEVRTVHMLVEDAVPSELVPDDARVAAGRLAGGGLPQGRQDPFGRLRRQGY